MLDKNDLKAIEQILDTKLDEKLNSIKEDIRYIREKLNGIEADIKRIKKAATDDILAVSNDIGKIKKKIARLESKIKLLQTQKV
jgi:archaellum component FlaC